MEDILGSSYVCIIAGPKEKKRVNEILKIIKDTLEENFPEIHTCIIVLLKNIH